MEDSYLGDQRIELEDYEAIDRAMLDCFSETGHSESVDYLSAPSFNMMNNLFNQSQQRGAYSYNKDLPPRKHCSAMAAVNQSDTQMLMQMSSNSVQYPSHMNLNDCGSTSSSSDLSLCQINQMRHPNSIIMAGPDMGPTNKRKLSASIIKYEGIPNEAVPTKSELKSQHVIVSRERRRCVYEYQPSFHYFSFRFIHYKFLIFPMIFLLRE